MPLTTTELAELRALEAAWLSADDSTARSYSASRRARRLEFQGALLKHAPALLDAASALAAIYALSVLELGFERYALRVAHVLDDLDAMPAKGE